MATAVMNLQDLRTQLAAKLQEQKNTLPPPTSTRIKAVAKEGFALPTGEVIEELEAIVVDVRYVNALYLKPYKAGVIETPSCWAVSADANTMVPDEKSEKAVHSACEGCPNNEWGSGANGSGKKCKNTIRLALLQPDATDKSPILTLDLPPTSTGPFLKTLRTLTVPIQTVVMRFSLDPKQTYAKVLTELLSPAPDAVAPYLLAAIDKAQPLIGRGFDYDN